jgi:hypothetical protein
VNRFAQRCSCHAGRLFFVFDYNRIGVRIEQGLDFIRILEFNLVHPAIAVGVVVDLFRGILEFGIAFRDRLTVSSGTQSAGRVAAALGNQDDADIATLQAIEQSLGLLGDSSGDVIKHVQIWKSNGSGQPVSGCSAPGAGGGNCNWYEYKPETACNWKPCPDPDVSGYSYGGGFVPAGRDVTLDDDGLTTVGVTVLFSHDWITSVLPVPDVVCDAFGDNCWSDTALFRLEPQNFGE